ncbi:hypothetical protein [Streptosporangium amethystogenes]|uniref:hypothetical protein n=1 Tax=Streptosporangium amethystogenes TaxID=2002 RepID=UPI0012F78DBD|nr:hypothetical protein [Streptosporangium amethystogenes]
MTTITNRPPSTHTKRPTAMYLGLALTTFATLALLLDIATVDTLSGHVRDAYPD